MPLLLHPLLPWAATAIAVTIALVLYVRGALVRGERDRLDLALEDEQVRRAEDRATHARLEAELRQEARARDGRLFELQGRLTAESERRAAAEVRAGRVAALETRIEDMAGRLAEAEQARAALQSSLEAERAAAEEKLALLDTARAQLKQMFENLSNQALHQNNERFLDLARRQMEQFHDKAATAFGQRQTAISALIDPVHQSLTKMDGQIQALERTREGAYAELKQQVVHMAQSQDRLRTETAALVRALRTPQTKGRWGEMQLRRVVEMAGMIDHCDFFEQSTTTLADGGSLRPDMLVRLPGGKHLIIDAKAPTQGFLDAVEADTDAARAEALTRHARQVRDHMKALGTKAYWQHVKVETPDFVVMFVPGENFFSAALEKDPTLIEAGIADWVIPATPTTLIALLRAVAYGWRQESLTENARQIAELGQELHERLAKLGEHFGKVGAHLGRAVGTYNDAVGTLERRVLPTARRFKDLQAAAGNTEIAELEPVAATPRRLQAAEFAEVDAGAASAPAIEIPDGGEAADPVRPAAE